MGVDSGNFDVWVLTEILFDGFGEVSFKWRFFLGWDLEGEVIMRRTVLMFFFCEAKVGDLPM